MADGVDDAEDLLDALADALDEALPEELADALAEGRAEVVDDDDDVADAVDSGEAGDEVVVASSAVGAVSVVDGAEHPASSTKADVRSPTRVRGWFWGFIVVSLTTKLLIDVPVTDRPSWRSPPGN